MFRATLKSQALAIGAVATFALGMSTQSFAATASIRSSIGRAPGAFAPIENGGRHAKYTFRTIDNPGDPTFNQLLGINNSGEICGYFGSGITGHPFQGYTLKLQHGQPHFRSDNFPGASATQVVAINNRADTAGFWVDGAGNNFGFVEWNGVFTSYKDPHTTGTVNQLLGINDAGIAVGFYSDSNNMNHGYTLNQATGHFEPVAPPSSTNVTAAGINNSGDVTGFYTASNGAVVGFLRASGRYSTFAVPGAVATTPFGINDKESIVGSYLDGAGATHGFLLTNPLTNAHFTTLDDRNAAGMTVINGINNLDQLVGFYEDAATNFHGLLVTP